MYVKNLLALFGIPTINHFVDVGALENFESFPTESYNRRITFNVILTLAI